MNHACMCVYKMCMYVHSCHVELHITLKCSALVSSPGSFRSRRPLPLLLPNQEWLSHLMMVPRLLGRTTTLKVLKHCHGNLNVISHSLYHTLYTLFIIQQPLSLSPFLLLILLYSSVFPSYPLFHSSSIFQSSISPPILPPSLLLHSLSYPFLPLHLSILPHLSSLTLNLPASLCLSQAIPSSFSAGVLPHLPHHRREDSSRQDAGPHAIWSVLLLTAHVYSTPAVVPPNNVCMYEQSCNKVALGS